MKRFQEQISRTVEDQKDHFKQSMMISQINTKKFDELPDESVIKSMIEQTNYTQETAKAHHMIKSNKKQKEKDEELEKIFPPS